MKEHPQQNTETPTGAACVLMDGLAVRPLRTATCKKGFKMNASREMPKYECHKAANAEIRGGEAVPLD